MIEVFRIPISKDQLRALILECHEITTILVHRLVDRTRSFTSNELHDEKMVSLGKLSAGLAHELNNPLTAILGVGRPSTTCGVDPTEAVG